MIMVCVGLNELASNYQLIWILCACMQQPGLNVITELIIGYMYPGKPIANVAFKTYGYTSMVQAISFLGDFKLGHYMKIPPKSMFIVQVLISYVHNNHLI